MLSNKTALVDCVISIYNKIKLHRRTRDEKIHEQRELGKKIAKCKSQQLIDEASLLHIERENLELTIEKLEHIFSINVRQIPNLTHPHVKDTPVSMEYSNIPCHELSAKDHVQIGEALNILDFTSAASITGNKFYYLKNEAVLLENTLITFALNLMHSHGFQLFYTPDITLIDVVDDMGFSPRSENSQIYQIKDTDFCLIGTSEITLGALHRNQILNKDRLPLRYSGISHCFRKEAGAPGKESRGLYRVHQFTKVEMFVFCLPNQSEPIFNEFLDIEKHIYQSLGLPWRVVDIPAYDLGNPAYQKLDIEVWMPGRGEYGEVTSASNCTDYQSRRLKTRYQGKDPQDKGLVYTLNGTAIAIPRTILAILENFQQKDGSVLIPPVLIPYTGFKVIKTQV